jgi:hypothetical protein
LRNAMSSIETSSPLEACSDRPPGHVYNHHGARQADALVQVARQSLCSGSPKNDRPALPEMIVHVDFDAAAGGFGQDCRLDGGVPLVSETALRLSCDAALVPLIEDSKGKPLSVGRRTRSIPTPLRRALSARDVGCRFPGCSNKRFLDGHHIRHWSKGGHTSLDNLVELCSYHHRLVHEGGYSVKRSADGFEFLRRDGTLVPHARVRKKYSSDLLFPDGRRIATEPQAICSEWLGDPVNLGCVIEALCSCAPTLGATAS